MRKLLVSLSLVLTTLFSIASADAAQSTTFTKASIVDMEAMGAGCGLTAASVYVQGIGLYKWNGASTATVNSPWVIQCTGVTTGRMELDVSTPVYVPTASIAALEAYGASSASVKHAEVQCYYATGPCHGGGRFDWLTSYLPSGGADGGIWIAATGVSCSATGCWHRADISDLLGFSPYMFGAKCGGVQVTDGVSTVGSPTITSATAAWTSDMVGWQAVVNKAYAGGQQLVTTVSSVGGVGSLTLAANAGASGTAETVSLYPDDTAAFTNMFAAAGTEHVILMPAGQTCGVANPGTASSWLIKAPAIFWNGATIWTGQTGPTSDTGWSFNLFGNCNTALSPVICTGTAVVGPGTLDGLYQTDQGVAQNSLIFGLQFGSPPYVMKGASATGMKIQNTKGPGIYEEDGADTTVSDTTVQNCGDYSYQHSSTPGDMTGRPICVIFQAPTGFLKINNLTTRDAAQTGLLVQNTAIGAGAGGPADFTLDISNYSSSGDGYPGLDLEEIVGSVNLSNLTYYGDLITASGALQPGGFIFRDIARMNATNINCILCTSNAFSSVATDGHVYMRDWHFTNLSFAGLDGTLHGAQTIYFGWNPDGGPQSVSINGMNYDRAIFQYSGPACNVLYPQFNVLDLTNIHTTSQSAETYDTIFEPVGSAGTFTYIHARDSSLGRVNIDSTGSFTGATLFDFPNTFTQGAPTVTGGIASADFGPTTISNPQTSFTCPL